MTPTLQALARAYMALPGEEWRPVPGLEGRYDVSNMGRVRSYLRPGSRTHSRCEEAHLVRGGLMRGYPTVLMKHGDVHKHRRVHQLVMLAFVGPPPAGHVVRHLDGVRTNNTLSNLVYGTPHENHLDRYRHGTMLYGEDIATHKLTGDDVAAIRTLLRRGIDGRVIADLFGVSKTTISRIRRGETWTTTGDATAIDTPRNDGRRAAP